MAETTLISNAPESPEFTHQTLADLVERLGGIPLSRIWCDPPPGTANEGDVLRYKCSGNGEKHLLELIDGTLVEKPVGLRESILAVFLARMIGNFVADGNLGWVAGTDGPFRLAPGSVRYPDVSFISRTRFPDGLPEDQIGQFDPDLAIEVLSPSNTTAEMQRKREELFAAGTRLVWMVDLSTRSVRIYRDPNRFQELTETDELDGEDVLPGFTLSIQELFATLN